MIIKRKAFIFILGSMALLLACSLVTGTEPTAVPISNVTKIVEPETVLPTTPVEETPTEAATETSEVLEVTRTLELVEVTVTPTVSITETEGSEAQMPASTNNTDRSNETSEVPASHITVRRSGGFAGVEQLWEFDSVDPMFTDGRVPTTVTEQIWGPVNSGEFFDYAANYKAPAGSADLFQYDITVVQDGIAHTVTTYDFAPMPASLQGMIQGVNLASGLGIGQ